MEQENALYPFEGKQIRKIWHDEKWYFSIVDVVAILTDSPIPRNYWTKVKKSIIEESQTHPFWMQLKMTASDGRMRLTDCTHTEGVLRIAMSVPSPKAEPLKQWLAQVGRERIEETESPELLTEKQAELYRAKGYPEEWIKQRVQTIQTRNQLTTEWKNRGVVEGQEYSILTATIAKGTFGLTPKEHSELKGLDKQNLRDHMTPMELILTAFSEEATRQIAIRDNAQGFSENHEAAQLGGIIGAKARLGYEQNTGLKVVSSENYLGLTGSEKPKEIGSIPEDII
ncbi:MAG: phage antirepressor protein [Saprospiraceae bacterium]|nr:phage antirepressor protein [Saprospiraceae bacterium]